MTRDEALSTLRAIKRELSDNRLTIVRQVINAQGDVLRTYRKTVRVPVESLSRPGGRKP